MVALKPRPVNTSSAVLQILVTHTALASMAHTWTGNYNLEHRLANHNNKAELAHAEPLQSRHP